MLQNLLMLQSINPKCVNFINIFILGIASGLPLALILSTLSIWLQELGISKTAIGLFAFVTSPYSLKFLWSPFIDGLKIPVLTKKFGLRKSWLFILQLLLFVNIFCLSLSSPLDNLYYTALLALLISFFSASQDIVIDAYRIEIFAQKDQGFGATLLVYGYRIGILISTAGALIIADMVNFMFSYQIMSGCFLFFAFYSLTMNHVTNAYQKERISLISWINKYVKQPFIDFKQRENYGLIILFVILYKLGDAFAGIMLPPFILDLGFSKLDIAFYVKTIGLIATLLGALFGAVITKKLKIYQGLMLAGILQLLTNLIFCVQAYIGKNSLFLAITILAENFAAGMGTIIFVAYISGLCNVKYSATQYALLSSVAAIARTWLSSSSGYVADHVNWIEFFVFSALLALPALILLKYISKSKIFSKVENDYRNFKRS